jgi:hypothetical protein
MARKSTVDPERLKTLERPLVPATRSCQLVDKIWRLSPAGWRVQAGLARSQPVSARLYPLGHKLVAAVVGT